MYYLYTVVLLKRLPRYIFAAYAPSDNGVANTALKILFSSLHGAAMCLAK